MASPAALISSAVVHLPSENRTAERACSIGKPIASNTCDATTDPTMQAEPLDAQTPSKSSAMSSISQSCLALLFTFAIAQCPFGGRCHTRNCRDIFGPGASLVFVRAAEHDRLNGQSAAEVEKTNAFWSVKFVRSETGGVDQREINTVI